MARRIRVEAARALSCRTSYTAKEVGFTAQLQYWREPYHIGNQGRSFVSMLFASPS